MDALKSTVCLNCGGEVEVSADGRKATDYAKSQGICICKNSGGIVPALQIRL